MLFKTGKAAELSQLWLDRSDALALNQASKASAEVTDVARQLITDGVAVVPNVIDEALCQRAIAEHQAFCDADPERVRRDTLGREVRVVNLHRSSPAAMEIGTNPSIMAMLDYLFGMEACFYTSLTFKYGTQQPIHRDTPHFSTWPGGYYFGVWYALEDVNEDAGPLMLHRGAHRFAMDERAIFERLSREHPFEPPEAVADLALKAYCDEIISKSLDQFGPPETLAVKRGDVVIWHPGLPHGGSLANDPMLTRWSIVCHCAPVDVQVHQHQTFFRHRANAPPPPRYGYIEAHGRKVAVAGDAGFPPN